MIKKLSFGLLLAALVWATPSYAKPERYTFDPLHTQISFTVSHLGFSYSTGKFLKFSGGFIFDEEKPEESSVDVTIDANSLNMDSTEWEDHLKAKDFFNVKQFPTIHFKSTKVEPSSKATGQITGDLTILGVTKPVTLDVIFNKVGTHPYTKNKVAGFSATAGIYRSDFGMNYALPDVGDSVTINIEVEGIRQDFDSIKKK